jgi:type II secretory pathway component GspD/PulD (secretin)
MRGQARVVVPAILMLMTLGVSSGLCMEETVIVKLQFRSAQEALPMVRGMLSPEGKVTADVRTNSLVVTDDGASLGRVRDFLEKYDRPVRQARIRVRFEEVRAVEGRSASAEAKASGKGWTATTGRRGDDGAEVRLSDRHRQRRTLSEYFITALSGSPAYIAAGQEILYRERWGHLCRRYGGRGEITGVRRITSGFEVTPVIVGDRAQLEIVPRISLGGAGGRREVIRFTEAVTRVAVPLGQWVTIGGTEETSNEVIREILATGSGSRETVLSISLMVVADQ